MIVERRKENERNIEIRWRDRLFQSRTDGKRMGLTNFVGDRGREIFLASNQRLERRVINVVGSFTRGEGMRKDRSSGRQVDENL